MKYEYRLVHVGWGDSHEETMNRWGNEGFRVVQSNDNLVIMERVVFDRTEPHG
jgi:hypothetical protein